MADCIFTIRKMTEKWKGEQKILHMVFIKLEKEYYRVLGNNVLKFMSEHGVTKSTQ